MIKTVIDAIIIYSLLSPAMIVLCDDWDEVIIVTMFYIVFVIFNLRVGGLI